MNAPIPAPDTPPAGNQNAAPTDTPVDPATAERDAGMYEAGTPSAIERRLLHVDRTTEETLVLVRSGNGSTLALVAMVAIVGGMVYLLHRELAALALELAE